LHEQVVDQLQKVLARELEIKLTNRTEWKSVDARSLNLALQGYLAHKKLSTPLGPL
jgi:hypothetical protein